MQEAPEHKEEFIALIGEDLAGMKSQLFGLSDRLGIEARFFPIKFNTNLRTKIARSLPSRFWRNPLVDIKPIEISSRPKAIISVGRRGARVGHALSVKFRCPIIQIQDPAWNCSKFDLILAPHHDKVKGANVVELATALHPYTPEKMHSLKVINSSPVFTVLLGGSNKRFRLDYRDAAPLAEAIQTFVESHQVKVEIIPSRRTDTSFLEVLRLELAKLEDLEGKCKVWSMDDIEASTNPYPRALVNSEYIAITQDSVSMISEACATSSEVFIIPMRGRSMRLEAFIAHLLEIKRVRWFHGASLRKEDIKDKKLKSPLDDGIKATESVKMLLEIN